MGDPTREASSFRDPSGFLFWHDGELYRQVSRAYAPAYQRARSSGLLALAVERGWLLPFDEVPSPVATGPDVFLTLKPARIPFVSYPYEWSFTQVRDAGLLTLDLHLDALRHGLILKDASIYNIQFWHGRPILIDHLSFDLVEKCPVWPAYGQFCRHFLAPLALAALVDTRLGGLYRTHLDGIPLDLATRVLPMRSRLRPGLLLHLHAHAASQSRYADRPASARGTRRVSSTGMQGIAASLRRTIASLRQRQMRTPWGDYYAGTNYSPTAMADKQAFLRECVTHVRPSVVWDLGANTGVMSRVAAESGALVVSFDIDPWAVDQNYLRCRREGEQHLLPLLMDFTNPSPAQGFAHTERQALTARGPADLVLALALVHHLVIANNVPLALLAGYLAELGSWLLVEFVPRDDSQVQRLLATREDIFHSYTQDGFETAFGRPFSIVRKAQVRESARTLYLMKGRG